MRFFFSCPHHPNPTTLPSFTLLIQVIKVGTSSLICPSQATLNLGNLAHVCEAARDLAAGGHRVVLVSSGAVGAGAARMGLTTRPADLASKQALAAIGQVHLMRYYDDFFGALRLPCAQVLLTLDNLADRSQYACAAATFGALAASGAIPVVNENDTVAVQELRFGDNDTLAAHVATLVHADWLFLMTDVDGLYTANPATDASAARIPVVPDLAALAVDTGGPGSGGAGSQWGTGGMATKLTAARIATAAGCATAVLKTGAHAGHDMLNLIAGDRSTGTVFCAVPTPTRGRKRWIPAVPVKGTLRLDAGAAGAVRERGKSLFAAGVVAVEGEFAAQDAVSLAGAGAGDPEFARAIVNYSSEEVRRIAGLSSGAAAAELGYSGPEEVAHRGNIALLAARGVTPPPPGVGGGGGGSGGGGHGGAGPSGTAGRASPPARPPSAPPHLPRPPSAGGAGGGGGGGAPAPARTTNSFEAQLRAALADGLAADAAAAALGPPGPGEPDVDEGGWKP
jgi:glutamate 5-kinase